MMIIRLTHPKIEIYKMAYKNRKYYYSSLELSLIVVACHSYEELYEVAKAFKKLYEQGENVNLEAVRVFTNLRLRELKS